MKIINSTCCQAETLQNVALFIMFLLVLFFVPGNE